MKSPARLAATLGAFLTLAACGLVRPVPLDLAPGHRIVLGRVDASGFEADSGSLEIQRDDGTFGSSLPFGRTASEFAIGLPPGRYHVLWVRGGKDRGALPNLVVWEVKMAFEVGDDPAVYIGTLRLRTDFGQLRVSIENEMERTLAVLRSHYSNLPDTVVLSLATP